MCRVTENLPHFGVGRKFATRGVSWGFMKNEDAAHSDAWGFWPLSDHGHGPTCGRDGGGARDIVRTAKPIRGGLVGGSAGLVVGQALGSLVENERRRRNTVENELNNTQL